MCLFFCSYSEGSVCFVALTGKDVFTLLLLQGGMCLFCCPYRKECVCFAAVIEKDELALLL